MKFNRKCALLEARCPLQMSRDHISQADSYIPSPTPCLVWINMSLIFHTHKHLILPHFPDRFRNRTFDSNARIWVRRIMVQFHWLVHNVWKSVLICLCDNALTFCTWRVTRRLFGDTCGVWRVRLSRSTLGAVGQGALCCTPGCSSWTLHLVC